MDDLMMMAQENGLLSLNILGFMSYDILDY